MPPLTSRPLDAQLPAPGACRLGLALCTLLAFSACGGRWRTITTTDDDSAESGGAIGAAGATSRAGSSGASTGGASTGGASTGGASMGGASMGGASVGGASMGGSGATGCAQVVCPGIACPGGSSGVIPAGQCCPMCQPVCSQVCAACGPGTQPVLLPGACCPQCVLTKSCAAGRATYEQARSTAVYKFSFGCSSDAECASVSSSNACESCLVAAVVANEVEGFTEYLNSEATQDCAPCGPAPILPCQGMPGPHCVGGQCLFATR